VTKRALLLVALFVGAALFTAAPAEALSITAAPTLSTDAAGALHVRYSVSFQVGAMLGPTGTITIAAPAGTVLPTFAQIQDTTAGTSFSRSGVRSAGNATLTLHLCCSDTINSNDVVTVTLDDVKNPNTTGSQTLAVSTSAESSVTSPAYTLNTSHSVTNVTAPSLSSTAGGVQHVRYSFGFNAGATNGGLVSPGTITIAAPAGTVLPTFAQIRDDDTGASFSRSGARANSNATLTLSLCCTDAINPGDHVTITIDDVKNAATGSNYTFNVSTSSSPTAVASSPYSLTAPEQITGVTPVSLSSAAGGIQHVRYSVGFNASGSTGGLVAPGTIAIAAPPGTVMPTFAQITDNTTGFSFSRSGARSNGNSTLTLSLCCSDAINPGDSVTITINDVTNPGTGAGYVLNLATSSNPAGVSTPTFSLTAPQQVTGVTPVAATTDAKGKVSDSFSFTASVPTGRLVAPGTITIAAPPGTVFPTFAQIRDDTTGNTFSRSGVRSNSNATLTLSLCCSDQINPGDTVTVTAADVTNPASGAGPFTVSTSSDTVAAQTPPRPPPPVLGKQATAAVEKGVVLVKLPGQKGFVKLSDTTTVPVGSVLDTTKGQVGLTFATNTAGATQRGSFSLGQFQVQQSKKNPLTTLSMMGGGLNTCKEKIPKGGAPKQAFAARKRRRTLFSSVRGHFATRGRNSSATVRGTKWSMTDTCAGTTTKVTRGSVMVRDFTLKKNHLVKAGHSYFARAPKAKKHP
jgi:predicted RNA-binding protein with TRAM domain